MSFYGRVFSTATLTQAAARAKLLTTTSVVTTSRTVESGILIPYLDLSLKIFIKQQVSDTVQPQIWVNCK